MTNTGKLVLFLSLFFGGIFLAAALLIGQPDRGGAPSVPDPNETAKQDPKTPSITYPDSPRETAKVPTGENPPRLSTTGRSEHVLRGRVVNEQNSPVANATVSAEQGIANLLVALKGTGSSFKVSAKTDSSGYYQFEGLPPHENYIVTATHPDYAPARHSYVPVHADEPTDVATLVLESGFAIEGVVLDVQRIPIANATVSAEASLLTPFLRQGKGDEAQSTKTDAAGSFRLTRIPKGQVSLTARAKGYGTRTIPNVTFPQNEKTVSHEIVLEEGKAIEGKVVDASGQPVPKANIEATSYSNQNPSKGSAVSNHSGGFTITDLSDATYVLVVTADNYSTKRENRITPGQPVTITLTAQGSVSGRVIAKKTGQPITSFTLEARRPLPNGSLARLPGETRNFQSEDGSFTFSGLDPEHQYVLLATAQGYAPTISVAFTIVGPEPVTGFQIGMGLGGSIRGRVVDAKTGDPIAGANVQTRDTSYVDNPLAQMFGMNQEDSMHSSTRTSGKGEFTLSHIAPGNYQVEITAPGFTSKLLRDVLVAEDETTSLDSIAMTSGGSIAGAVYDPSGRPFPGAEVTVRSLSPGSLFTRNALTDQLGRFTIRNIPPGEYQLAASAGSFHAGNIFEKIRQINDSKKTVSLREGDDIAGMNFVVSN